MSAELKRYIPQEGTITPCRGGESLSVSETATPAVATSDTGCPSYSGGGKARSKLMDRFITKTTAHTTDSDASLSEQDNTFKPRKSLARSPPRDDVFYSPIASSPLKISKRKRGSPVNTLSKDLESLEREEESLWLAISEKVANTFTMVSDRQGPYRNTSTDIKHALRLLNDMCANVKDARTRLLIARLRRAEEKEREQQEATPKRARKIIGSPKEKATNTSTWSLMTEGPEWDPYMEIHEGSDSGLKGIQTGQVPDQEANKRQEDEQKNEEEGWNKVEKKKTKKTKRKEATSKRQETKKVERKEEGDITTGNVPSKPRRVKQRTKPEAVLIRVTSDSFAEVLKKVKTGLISNNAELTFSSVRKTQKGDLLLEMERGQKGASEIKDSLNRLCPDLYVKTLKDMSSVLICGLDMTCEKEEIEEVLKDRCHDFNVRRIWISRSNTKSAIIDLTKEDAQKLAEEKKVRIGWMRASVRPYEEKQKCFRCLEYGHIAAVCPGEDRSRRCLKCGAPNHKTSECTEPPACVVCKDKGLASNGHRTGSKLCPSWAVKVPGKRNSKNLSETRRAPTPNMEATTEVH